MKGSVSLDSWKLLLDLQGSRSIRFLVDFRGQRSSIDKIRGRVNREMQRIQSPRITTRGRLYAFVAVLHVLQMEKRAVTVASKDILAASAKVLQNKLPKTRILEMLRNNGMDFGMSQLNMILQMTSICLRLGATKRTTLFR